MNRLRILSILAALLAPLLTVGTTRALPAQAGPTVPFQGGFPMTVDAGDYDLLYLVLDFAPGAGIPLHFHGGPATVIGMEGQLTLRPHDAPERKLNPGDVVNEKAGVHHVMTNVSDANARILAVILLPKGAEVTTVVDTANPPPGPTVPFQGSYPISVTTGEYDLVNLVLDFAPGASIPWHFHGGPAVVVGMEGELTLRPKGGAERKLRATEVVNEKAGAIHEMVNTSNANARILAGVLLPKGTELTTLVQQLEQPTGMPRTGTTGIWDTVLPLLFVAALFLAMGSTTFFARSSKRP
jgi:quercetin dioxygenase-like cupin family protein